MAQRRLCDYQDPLGSFEHNLIRLGVHNPGRFSGFDTLKPTGQFQFSVTHEKSGINTFDDVGDAYGPIGVLFSTQGVMIVEDAQIDGLIWTTNAGNANDRIDYVIVTHQYLQLTNGVAAVYSVLQGGVNGPVPSTLAPFQVVIGRIDIPAGVVNISDCTYTKARCPDSGDSLDARLDLPNDYTAINQNGYMGEIDTPAQQISVGSALVNLFDLNTKGNLAYINAGINTNIDGIRIVGGNNTKNGTEITLVINQYCRIRNGVFIPFAQRALGYAAISFSDRLSTTSENINGTLSTVMQPPVGNTTLWFVTLQMLFGTWYVKSVDGIGFNTSNFTQGMVMDCALNLTEYNLNFDSTGLGFNRFYGWAVENGAIQNGYQTREVRGRLKINASNLPATNSPAYNILLNPKGLGSYVLGSTGGESTHIQTPTELAAHHHKLNGNGNSGLGGAGGISTGSYTNHETINDSNTAGDGTFLSMENAGVSEPMNTLSPYLVSFSIVYIL